MKTLYEFGRSQLRHFSADRSGSIAIMFGLSVMIIFACSAIAVDYSRVNRGRGMVLTALDAAALATAKQLRLQGTGNAELLQLADAYFQSNLRAQRPGSMGVGKLKVEIDRIKSRTRLSIDITVPTLFGNLFQVDKFGATLVSEAVYAARDIELGMMLDVSGSMAGGKISALRGAAKDLVEIVIDEAQGPSKNRIGIAPYSTSVNAGTFAAAATNNANPTWSSCVTERSGTHAFTDAPPEIAPLKKGTTSCPINPVLPLTNNKSLLQEKIGQLDDGGSTAGHLGIAWSWYLVSPQWANFWPSDSAPRTYEDPEVMKAVIIMTDGMFNATYQPANGNSAAQANALCSNIKHAGVTVFTVGFEAPTEVLPLLKQCATKDAYFFDAKNASELRDAFNRIARELTGLRLTN